MLRIAAFVCALNEVSVVGLDEGKGRVIWKRVFRREVSRKKGERRYIRNLNSLKRRVDWEETAAEQLPLEVVIFECVEDCAIVKAEPVGALPGYDVMRDGTVIQSSRRARRG